MMRPTAKSIGLSGYRGRKKQTLLTAARHNLRTIQCESGANGHIDAARICLNEILSGPQTPDGVEALAQALRDGIGYKPKRHDYTQAHELLFTLAAQTRLDTRAFFEFCLAFVVGEFGHDSVLSATIHRDESAPHLHILLSPIVEGRYAGSSLITKPSLEKLIDKFASDVFKAFDVKVEKTETGKARAQTIQAVQDGLKSILGPHISDDILSVILKAAGRNPAPFKAAMGITTAPLNDGGAEFRRIALSTGKGPKRERTQEPYGFESGDDVNHCGFDGRKYTETIPCVVSPKTPPPQQATTASPAPRPPAPAPTLPKLELIDSDGAITTPDNMVGASITSDEAPIVESRVVRDSDLDPTLFDATTGEYFKRPAPDRTRKQVAQAWVNTALTARSAHRTKAVWH